MLLGIKASSETPAFWRIVAWTGSVGWGLTVFICTLSLIKFNYCYHSFKGIIATPAFLLYPEQRDLWTYLIALTIIPVVTIAGYIGWSTLITLNQQGQGGQKASGLALITSSFLLGWGVPLDYLYTSRMDFRQVGVFAALFAFANIVVFVHNWLLARPSLSFPPLLLQGEALLIGLALGIALLTAPITPPILTRYPIYGVLALCIIFWVYWLIASYFLSRLLHVRWSVVAENAIIGALPLSLLPAHALFWWKVRQGGNVVLEYMPLTLVYLFWSAIAVALLALSYKSLGSLARSKQLWSKASQRWFLYIAIPLLLYVLAYNPNIHRPLDLFHEGERLSPGYAIARGQVPYKDVVFVHGFLRDPGIALIAFRLFGESVAALRILEQMLYPLVIVLSYYFALLCVGEIAILFSLLSLTGFWPFFYDWRMIPCLLTLTTLTLMVRKRSLKLAVIAGLLSFVALMTSLDVGIICIITGLVLVIGLAIVLKQRAPLVAYSLSLALCFGLIALLLNTQNALSVALQWNVHILAVSREWNGMPFPTFPDLSNNWALAVKALLSPIASIGAGIYLLLACAKQKWEEHHWSILMLLIVNMLLYNRALVGGQLHSSHLQDGSHFAPLLLLILLVGNRKRENQNQKIRPVVSVLLMLALLTPSQLSGGRTFWRIIERLPAKNRIEIPSTWVLPNVERVGSLFLPPDQAQQISEIVAFLSQSDSFWDFTDHGALYFLSAKLSPTRFYATHHVITLEDQQEVITALEQNRPTYILFRSGTGWDAIAGIDRTVRSFLVSEYLLRNYHYYAQIGGFVILERGSPDTFPQPVAFQVNMGYIPLLLEQLPFWHSGQPPVEILNGDWNIGGDGYVITRTAQEWHIIATGPDVQLQNLALDINPRSISCLRVRMLVKGALNDLKAQVFWRSDNEEFSEERSVLFNVISDAQEHIYLIPLASFPNWAWSEAVTGLRFDPVDGPAEVIVTSIELLYTGDR